MCKCSSLFYFLLLHLVRAQCRGASYSLASSVRVLAFAWAARRHMVSVPSFSNPSHPGESGVSDRAAWLQGSLCGVSLLPFPLFFCRVRLLPFGAAFEFPEVPEELSLWAGGLGLPFRHQLTVPPPGLPLAPMVVGAVGRCPQTGS